MNLIQEHMKRMDAPPADKRVDGASRLRSCYSRFLSFASDLNASSSSPSSSGAGSGMKAVVVRSLVDELRTKLGACAEDAEAVTHKLSQCVDDSGLVDFATLITGSASAPVKMEIGSGAGEWAVAQVSELTC